MSGSSYLYRYFHLDGDDEAQQSRRSNCFQVNVLIQMLRGEDEIQSTFSRDLVFITEIFRNTYGFFFEERRRLIQDRYAPALCSAASQSTNNQLANLYSEFCEAGPRQQVEEIGSFALRFQELYMAILLIWGGVPASVFERDVVFYMKRSHSQPASHAVNRKLLYSKLDLSTFQRLNVVALRQVTSLGFWVLQALDDVASLVFLLQCDSSASRVGKIDLTVDLKDLDRDYLVATAIKCDKMSLKKAIKEAQEIARSAWDYIQHALVAAYNSVASGIHIETLPLVHKRLYNAWRAIRSLESNEMVIRAFEYASIHNGIETVSPEPRRNQYLAMFYGDMRRDAFHGGVSRLFSPTYSSSNMEMNAILFREGLLIDINEDICSVMLDRASTGSVQPVQDMNVQSISQKMHKQIAAAMHIFTLRSMFGQIWETSVQEVCRGLIQAEVLNKGDSAICTALSSFRRLEGDYDVPEHISTVREIVTELDAIYKTKTTVIDASMPALKAIHEAGLGLAHSIKVKPLSDLINDQNWVAAYTEETAAMFEADFAAAAEGAGAGASSSSGAGAGASSSSGAGVGAGAVKGDETDDESDGDFAGGVASSVGAAGGEAGGSNSGPFMPKDGCIHIAKAKLSPYWELIDIGASYLPAPMFSPDEEESVNNALNQLTRAPDSLAPNSAAFDAKGFILIRSDDTYMTVRLKQNRKGFVLNYFNDRPVKASVKNGLFYFDSGIVWGKDNAPLFEMEVQTRCHLTPFLTCSHPLASDLSFCFCSKVLRDPVSLDWNVVTDKHAITYDVATHAKSYTKNAWKLTTQELRQMEDMPIMEEAKRIANAKAVFTETLQPILYKESTVLCCYNPAAPMKGRAAWKFTASLASPPVMRKRPYNKRPAAGSAPGGGKGGEGGASLAKKTRFTTGSSADRKKTCFAAGPYDEWFSDSDTVSDYDEF